MAGRHFLVLRQMRTIESKEMEKETKGKEMEEGKGLEKSEMSR